LRKEREQFVEPLVFFVEDVSPQAREGEIVDAFSAAEQRGQYVKELYRRQFATLEQLKERAVSTITAIRTSPRPLLEQYDLDFFLWNLCCSAEVFDKTAKIKCRTDVAKVDEDRSNGWLLQCFSPRMKGTA